MTPEQLIGSLIFLAPVTVLVTLIVLGIALIFLSLKVSIGVALVFGPVFYMLFAAVLVAIS